MGPRKGLVAFHIFYQPDFVCKFWHCSTFIVISGLRVGRALTYIFYWAHVCLKPAVGPCSVRSLLPFVPFRVARTCYAVLNITASQCMCATYSGVGPMCNALVIYYCQNTFMDAKHYDTSLLEYAESFPVVGLRSRQYLCGLCSVKGILLMLQNYTSNNFMVAPCINDIKHFIVQLMHTT